MIDPLQPSRSSFLAAAAVLTAVRANAELFRKYQGFADAVPVPASASALDQALAESGRDPAWTPID